MKSMPKRSSSRGVSLIEILISLVIGLVIVGAVLLSMIGSGKAGRYQAAYTQMNEDAQIGLSILSRELQQAGYSAPTGLVPVVPATVPPTQALRFDALAGGTYVIGCDTGFVNPRAVPLVCDVGTQAAFEVVYEADVRTTAPTGAGNPSDCLGNSIAVGPPYIARNRYFISNSTYLRPQLSCTSAAAAAVTQPLVENVEAMAVSYGVSVAAAPTQVVRYVTATDIRAVGPAEWFNVVSVRVCLVVRSTDPVLDNGQGEDTPAYTDCAGTRQTPTDRYLRRAYFTTAAIRDRMP